MPSIAEKQAQFRESALARAGEGILDIPDVRILRHTTEQALLDLFERGWGKPPGGVVIPIASRDGANLRNTPDVSLARSVAADPNPLSFRDIVGRFAELGLRIYLSLDPGLPFLRDDSVHIVDVIGDSSAQACIGKKKSQEISALLLSDALEVVVDVAQDRAGSLAGLVIDAVNLWPMGATNKRLELTCFCDECESYFDRHDRVPILDAFRTFPNPWNLVLAENEAKDGIAYIENFTSATKPEVVVGLSRQKGFLDIFGSIGSATLEQMAGSLLAYARIRHDQTVDAIGNIFTTAKAFADLPDNLNFSRIILTEGVPYDWTSGLFLDRLDNWNGVRTQPPCDEVWYDPTALRVPMSSMGYRYYMWRRSRYYIDAFFQFASQLASLSARAMTAVGKLDEDSARLLLGHRLALCLSARLEGVSSLSLLPEPESTHSTSATGGDTRRLGFVGPAFSQAIGDRVVDSVEVAPGRPPGEPDPRGWRSSR